MKCITAREARERMGQPDKTAIKFAKREFKKEKKKILKNIEIGVSEKKECIYSNAYYPSLFFEEPRFSRVIYEEEYKRLMRDFFTTLGYSVRFRCDWSSACLYYWGVFYISWKEAKSK